jgi:hypothetical protein
MGLMLGVPDDELAPETNVAEAEANAKLLTPPDGVDNAERPDATLPADQAEADEKPGGLIAGTTSGLSRDQARNATNMALQAAVLGYHHRASIHYTEGGQRWSGINGHKKAWRGQYPPFADCSAFVTWALWNGLDHYHIRDVVNRLAWRAGYTGTMLEHGRKVDSPFPGCAIIYGSGYPGAHTALYTGGGLVVSHGSEPGPMLIPWRYRSDVLSIRSYIW